MKIKDPNCIYDLSFLLFYQIEAAVLGIFIRIALAVILMNAYKIKSVVGIQCVEKMIKDWFLKTINLISHFPTLSFA